MKILYKSLLRKSFLLILLCLLHTSFKAQTGAALNFGSGNDYVQMSSLSFGSSWTAEAWIRPTSLFGNWNVVMGQCAYLSTLQQGFVIAVQNGSVFVDTPLGGNISIGISGGVWTHVAVTYNNGVLAFYNNGIIVGTKAVPFTNSSNPFYLGIRTDNTNSTLVDQYEGDIDEVRIWSVARSECDIQQYMNCEIPTTATGLVANYHFNQGIANSVLNYLIGPFTLTDNTGNGNTGNLTNFNLNLSGYSNWTSPGSPASGLTTPASAPTAEIDVTGNATSIVDGDVTPSTGDYTDFNGVATRTFVIYNTGTQTLNLTTPVFTGPDASSFSITTIPSTVIAAGTGTTSFVVAFTPTSLGAKTASINIYNQDCNEQFYKFAITATCVAGAALSFDGVDDYIETNANLAELGQADFTIEAKIKTTGNSMAIVACENSNGLWEIGEKCFYIDPSGKPNFVGYGHGYIFGNTAVNDGNWHHVAVVWDYSTGTSGVPKMYIDGVDQTVSATTYTANYANLGTFKIGLKNYNSEAPNNFSGELDEVRIWNRVLCLPEIIHNMNCELPSPTSQVGLNGYYKFNQGIAFGANTTITTAPDAAFFNNTGILTNFVLTGGPTSDWSAPGAVTSGASCSAYLDPEINIKGNAVNITAGDVTPSLTDYTDFGYVGLGSVLSRTFVIQNTGTAALTISSYNITGLNASSFTITTNPAASVVASGSTAIVVSFSAAALGAKTASLTINNNDCDESIYGFSVTATGAAAAAALNFDGTGDAINTTDPVIGLSDFTIEGWIKPNALTGGFLVSSRFTEGFSTGYWYTIGYGNGGLGLEMAECGNGGGNYVGTFTSSPTNSITPGTWGHFAIARSGSNYNMYINGNLSATFTETASHNFDNVVANPSHILNIGGWIQNNCCWFNGSMDELRIWKVARTQCEIQSFMNCEIPTTATNLVSNYHFNQGADALANPTINRLTDVSASASTGTLNASFALSGSSSNWIAPGGVTSGNTSSVAALIEIDVLGNSISIPDGSSSTSTSNFTDFNGALTQTFVIQNTIAGGTLVIGTPSITGVNANQFSITTLPASSINGVGSTNLVVSFVPTSVGVKNATITIPNNDCNESPYDFVITATAVAGAALSFDGVNDNASVASGISIYNQSFSFEFWAQRRANGVNGIVIGLGSTIATNQALQIGFRNSDYFTFAFYLNDMNYMGPQTTDGNFHHWACVYDAAGVSKNRFIYCDGILVLSDFSNSAFLGTGAVVIGDAGYGSNPFNGTVDEVRLWNKALSQCEIQSRMNCEIAGSQPSLTVNYHFNQGVAGGVNTSVISLTDDNTTPRNANLSNFSMTGLTSNFITPGGVISGNTTQTPPAATLAIEGNGNSIAAGSTAPLTSNFTDFGSATTRTFVLQNVGTGSLYINTGYFTGANAANFSVTTTPSSVITTGGSSNVVINFTPTALGSASAILNVVTSDCANPTYSFVITASTSPAQGLSFSGTSEYVALPVMDFSASNKMTFEVWVKPNNITGGSGYYEIMRQDIDISTPHWLVSFQNTGTILSFGLSTSSPTVYTELDVPINPTYFTDGNWHHIAAVYDGTAKHLYIDGIEAGTELKTGNITSGAVVHSLGRANYFGEFFDGNMDEVRYWNVARTECEIQSYMHCEIATTASGLVANYHFNQGIPSGANPTLTTLVDAASSNDGTLTNFTLTGNSSNWVSPGGVLSGSTTPAAPTASILVSGNSVSITPGATTTSTLNFTDFGTASTRTFVIQNSASGTLNISVPYFTGVNASEFSVTTLPSLSLAASATTSFVVAFTPTTGGFRTATFNINNNDCNIPIFNCAIGGTPTPASALNFDGANDYIACPNSIISTFTNGVVSGEAWVKMDASNSYQSILKNWGETPGVTGAFHFGAAASSDNIEIYITQSNGTVVSVADPTPLNLGAWYHLAFVADGTRLHLYRNGIEVGTPANYDGTLRITQPGLLIGAKSNNLGSAPSSTLPSYWNGNMDEIRIWNVARSQCEIQSYMNCEIPATASGLVANYHFNQGAAGLDNTTITSLSDAAGVNTGTLGGFSLLTGTLSNWVNPGGVISGSITPAIPTASVLISGNSTSIMPGATSATTLNFTDFGAVTSRTFVVQNSGTGTLNIGALSIAGTNAPQFSFAALPSSSLTTSGTSSFVVIFTPTSTGVSNATVHINTNDCTNGDFNFIITATAVTGSALSFDGVDDYVDLGNSTTLKPSAELTAESWVYSATWPALDRTILGNTENAGYGIFTTATGDLQGLVRRNGSWGTVNTPLSGLSAGWHHVALSYDGQFTYLYVDGILKTTDDAGATYTVDYIGNNTLLAGEASSGSSPVPGWFFNGQLDEVRIWDRALCQAEIQNNLHCEISATGNGLVAYYHFNDGIASGSNTAVPSLPDASGNNLSGTLNNMSKVGPTSNWVTPGAVISGSSCSVFLSSEIDVIGNGISIPDGATTPTIANGTDFSTVCVSSTIVKTFTLQNTGTAALTVSSFSLSGASASSFSVGVLSPASPIATNSTAVFSVSFAPSSAGIKTATLIIINNDCDEGTYDFAITGTANAIPSVTASITNSIVCAGLNVTLNGFGADTYTWNPSVTNALAFVPTASQVYTLTGTYTLTGCTNTNLATQGLTVNPIPTVAITAPNATICSGTNATLTAGGAGTGTYTWNPGPTNLATLIISPTITTTYTLVGTSTAGCISTNNATQLITVDITPAISATSVNTAICNTFSTTISVNGAATYSWFPGALAGGTVTVSPSVNTTYTATGYGATGCVSSNSILITVTVNSLPVVTATASNLVICNTGTTSLIGGGADTYTWNPAASNGQTFTPPTGTTSYTVTGTNTLTGCTSTNLAIQNVTVDIVPTVSITTTNSIICNGNSATLTANGATSYTWNPGNFTGAVFTPSPGVMTTYTVVGTSSAGCTSTNLAVQSVSVNALPTVSASISNSIICADGTITVNGSGASTYTWNNGAVDGVAFTPSATGSYSVAGTNSAGCTNTNVAIVSVTVNALPSLTITATNSVICFGNQTTLNGAGALTYTWSNGIINATAFSPTSTTQYTLSGTDANGCVNTALSTITVNVLPVLIIIPSSSVSCEAQSTTLTISGASSYTWNTAVTGPVIIVTPTTTTIYSITAIDVNACTNTVSYTQSVTPCPGTFTATMVKSDISCNGKDDGLIIVTASSSYSNPVYSYQWNSSLCPSYTCDTLKNLKAGIYNLTLKITYILNGFLVKTDSLILNPIVLTDLNGQCEITVYSGITANNDGVNDVMTIGNIEEFPNNSVTVFNRWGQEVVKINGYNNLDKAWPLKGDVNNLSSNTYFYLIDLGNGKKPIKGWIELIKN